MITAYDQAMTAFAELELATEVYYRAINKFAKAYDPKSVGLNEFAESIDMTLGDIEADIEDKLGGE